MAPPPIARRMRFFTDDDLHTMDGKASFIYIAVAREENGHSQLLTSVRP
jgi:hypothetical protein